MPFQAILERHALDDFNKLLVSPQSLLPAFRTPSQFAGRVQHARLGQAAPRLVRAMPDGGEGRLDRVGGADARPVFCGEVVER